MIGMESEGSKLSLEQDMNSNSIKTEDKKPGVMWGSHHMEEPLQIIEEVIIIQNGEQIDINKKSKTKHIK